jgi:hypothetical protein
MKPRMMSKAAMDLLFDHILDGFKSTYEGINHAVQQGVITEDDKLDLLKKNSERLIRRIHEFKVGQKLICIFFALLLGYMQITGEDLEMRRSGRRSSRSGRRRNETEMPEYL